MMSKARRLVRCELMMGKVHMREGAQGAPFTAL